MSNTRVWPIGALLSNKLILAAAAFLGVLAHGWLVYNEDGSVEGGNQPRWWWLCVATLDSLGSVHSNSRMVSASPTSSSPLWSAVSNSIADVIHLTPLPIIGIAIYMGLVSGYIPSSLYNRKERWPRPYAIFQVVLLALTIPRLTFRIHINNEEEAADDDDDDDGDYEYDYNVKELSSMTNWMGQTLLQHFYEEDAVSNMLETAQVLLADNALCLVAIMMMAGLARRYGWAERIVGAKNLPMSLVFCRNLALYVVITVWFVFEDLFDTESGLYKMCVNRFHTPPGWVAPDYPLGIMTYNFTEAWKRFHPSDHWLVRISHAILYPTILLVLTRRRLTTFLLWVLFFEIDIFHMLADMVHYVSEPELADMRLEFQGRHQECFVNVYVFETLFAYPMNFVYLATSWGDTVPPPLST